MDTLSLPIQEANYDSSKSMVVFSRDYGVHVTVAISMQVGKGHESLLMFDLSFKDNFCIKCNL